MISFCEEALMTTSRTFLSPLAAVVFVSGAVLAVPGCGDKTSPTSHVAVQSTLGNTNDHPQAQCQLGSQLAWINIGVLGSSKLPGDNSTVVSDGDAWQGQSVHVTACSVLQSGANYEVHVSVTQDGQGSFTVNTVSTPLTYPGPVSGVQGIFARGDTGTFRQDDCTLDFPRPEMGIKGGAIWAHINCPNVVFSGQNRTCGADAEFRFENCDGAP